MTEPKFDEVEAYEMFDCGRRDTTDIAAALGVSEALIYNSNADFRERVFLSCAEEFLENVQRDAARRKAETAS